MTTVDLNIEATRSERKKKVIIKFSFRKKKRKENKQIKKRNIRKRKRTN